MRLFAIIFFSLIIYSCKESSLREAPVEYITQITPEDSIIYKVPFHGPGQLESWYLRFNVDDSSVVSLSNLKIRLLSSKNLVKEINYNKIALDSLITKSGENASLSLIFHEPLALNIDNLEAIYGFGQNANQFEETVRVKLMTYQLKNDYFFPLKGNSLITAGYFNSGGHLSRATLFSIDAIGLTELYAPVTSEEEANASMAGWGRDIVSPAKGTVVFVERGIPDQPYGEYDRESYKRSDGTYAGYGNCVVIDFGNEEYGVFMHMQNGSVAVVEGDEVSAGQKLGEMGNSGDSFGPHLHFHLQNGPEPLKHQGLPVAFKDVSNKYLRKGEWVIVPQ